MTTNRLFTCLTFIFALTLFSQQSAVGSQESATGSQQPAGDGRQSTDEKTGIYVGEIKGPDEFVAERIRLLFMEEFSKVKMLEVVDSKERAQLVIDGIGRVETEPKAVLLSIKVVEPTTGRIVFAANRNEPGSASGASRSAVILVVRDMKRALKWK